MSDLERVQLEVRRQGVRAWARQLAEHVRDAQQVDLLEQVGITLELVNDVEDDEATVFLEHAGLQLAALADELGLDVLDMPPTAAN